MHQAFRFELDPNNRQRSALTSHAGAARFAWNWGLERVKAVIDARVWELELAGCPWTPLPSAIELHRAWNVYKREGAPWTREVSKWVPQEAFRDLNRALTAFFDSRAGRRPSRVGFPRFKKRGRCRERFRVAGVRLTDGRHVRLPRIGVLRSKERTDKLLRLVACGQARILSATVSRESDHWFVAITVERERKQAIKATYASPVGIDLGITPFATLSTGHTVDNPRVLERRRRRLRRLNRIHARRRVGGRNRARAARNLAREHYRIRCARNDFLHKLSTQLAKSHGTLVVESLQVAKMIRNRRLSRCISDAGWAQFGRMLDYKARWYGASLIKADPWYPSSKICSACGQMKHDLPLGERTYRCEPCGFTLDRDVNAARNLVALVAASGAETENACGDGVRPGISGGR
jgi:putative transposase